MAEFQKLYSEPQYWQAFLKGDHPAFEYLFKKYYNSLYQYARRYTRQESLAHECVQKLFYQLWVSRNNLSNVENVKAYLFKSLRTFLQKESRHQKIRTLESNPQPLTFSQEEIFLEEDESDQNHKKVIAKILNVLPQRQREAVYLKFYENLTYQEIANVLGINYQSVVNLVFRAIQRLREEDQLKKLAMITSFFPTCIAFFNLPC